MQRVFISTLQLTDYQDETLAMLDLINEFLDRGWHVDVYCHQYDNEIKITIDQLYAGKALFVTDSTEYKFIENYELLWLQYTSLNPSLLNRLLNGGMTTNIIFDHQALHKRETTPADIQLENRLANRVLVALSRLNGLLRDGGIEPSIIQVFPNPVSKRDDEQVTEREKLVLKKLLVIASESSSIWDSLADELLLHSVSCDVLNRAQWLQSEHQQDYDAVLTSGRIGQCVLYSGIPVYLYHGSEFIGYVDTELTEGNVFREETAGKMLSAKELAGEIITGYQSAVEYTQQRMAYYKIHWNLSAALDKLLKQLPTPVLKTITDQELQRLTLHNLTLRDKTKPFYSIDQWLTERLISPARRDFLQAFIQAYPEIGNIAVAIMAKGSDESSILTSLASIQSQYYTASEVYVLTDNVEGCNTTFNNTVWLSINTNASDVLNALIEKTSASFLFVLPAGEQLLPHALLLLAEHRLRFPSARAFYFDEAIIKEGKADNPILKPECNIDMLRSYPYIGRSLAFDVPSLRSLGKGIPFGAGLELYDAVWQLIEQEGPQAFGHIPEVLVYTEQTLFDWLRSGDVSNDYSYVVQRHLTRCNIDAHIVSDEKEGMCHIQYHHVHKPLVSIIIPTRDHLSVISSCIETLMEHTQYPYYELLIVDNQSTDPGTCQYLSKLAAMGLAQIQVLSWPHPFNFSAINNFAVEKAKGEVLLFLNNDTEITNGKWLEALLNHALRPEVGIVGAKLAFADGRIQHGGIVLGMNDSAAIAFQGALADSKGYMNRLCTTHNVSAVSAACMMMRRDVYRELGGFDEQQYPIYFGDVDLALKARQQGYLVVWTPDAELIHLGGASRLLQRFNLPPQPQVTDIDALYERWLPQLTNDPCYHPAYGKYAPGFALTPEMARFQQPLPGRPLPTVMGVHSDWHGCGHYRIILPFQALEREMHIEGGLKHGLIKTVDVADIAPDVVIIQGAAGVALPNVAAQYRRYTNATVVAEFDDYILNVPINSGNRKNFSQKLIKNFRKALDAVDWVVVSTPALAEAYSKYHTDIRVAYNRLPPSWWKGLVSLRRQGKKPRVGWAGGSSHKGDLAILRSVVKELENEVEWVFMGMKPEGVKCEFHAGVPIDYYPQKTASLNLDLALVPLEYNQFNECKSNLRLMELGACGVPVICTDIEPYRCALPVTRVDNRFKNWMDAIRMHLADMDATENMGNQLRDAVYQNWMLEGDGLTDWLQAWLPK
ncbi:glycosyltransferase [Pectobacterium brasiliense]|uniref:Glycosyltransferase n=1 Tax=Pectobacterium brasiliense TaxID=180957 RepID=A0AAE2WH42_9GAMM|nr:glycosyltransferase [Pectobacterium brasiliense]MBN3053145.1 glycosyltransferase [Pectobacterium brasiliense]MBN3074062.1 glycosyltransferase [Pectobacterium brasiliense]